MIQRNCEYCRCKMPRGSYVRIVAKRNRETFSCRSETDCFNRLLEQRNRLMDAGSRMASVFLNLSKRATRLHPLDSEVFTTMYRNWTAAKEISGL